MRIPLSKLVDFARLRRPLPGTLRAGTAALGEALRRLRTHRSSLAAAGCAFFGMLSLFPALTLLFALAGLVFRPTQVLPLLIVLHDFLPTGAASLVLHEARALLWAQHHMLGLGALVTTWAATNGTRAMLGALTLAYDGEADPGLRPHWLGLLITLVAVVVGAAGLALLVLLPGWLEETGLSHSIGVPLHRISVAMLLAFVAVSFAVLYRFGPPRRRGERRVVWPGTVLATTTWLGASTAFSAWVVRLAGLETRYGPLGATIGLMLWFYVSAWVTLLGAELNAALERRQGSGGGAGPGI
ncbi:YihY/virulence factor BrkB family protein [Rhodovastum atsumiense]|uniref:YihY/virulence factor BrkB family protein n=1 Tax=Rhodovastum atsumiense TaxID=504468 RepID=UPI00139F292B|nr:YihY/virulence factor BrkB family protein [Rhodovastum atsumiense]